MFKASKIGLLNFWIYDEEEYEFFDGKLLLRGKNGSGKSVTMQSFIPLILDGNKSPKRLDTFGGSDKHIEYYLLGDEKQENTGYLYMEFYHEEENRYITIGMGLHAKKGKPVEFWGFALTDNSRINQDVYLYKVKDGFHKTPLTKNELKSMLLSTNNRYVDSQKDYKSMVNDLLFGFQNIESYDEFINIILQIRSPKLSKEFKPTDLMKTLNDVLPPLNEEDLLPISETIESLNSTKEKLSSLNARIGELTNFIKVFHNYNESILYGKAKKYAEVFECHRKLLEQRETLKQKMEEKITAKEKLEKDMLFLKTEYEKATFEKEQIDNSDLKAKKERQLKLEQDIEQLSETVMNDTESLSFLDSTRKRLEQRKEEIENEIIKIQQSLEGKIVELQNQASKISFDELLRYLSLLLGGEFEDFCVIQDLVKSHANDIERIKNMLVSKTDLISQMDRLDMELDAINKEYDDLLESYETLIKQQEDAKSAFIQSFLENNQRHQELKLSESECKSIVDVVKEFHLHAYLKSLDQYKNFARVIQQGLLEEKSDLHQKLSNYQEDYKANQEKLLELRNRKEIEFEGNILEIDILGLLKEKNVKFLEFYKAIDFQEGISKEHVDQLEANLLSSGILSAKIIDQKDVVKVQDMNITYLLPSEKKKENLTKYFKVSDKVEGFSKDYIQSILEGISVSETDAVYLNPESFSFDGFCGRNVNYESKYIGFLKRKHEHEKQVELQEKLVLEIQGKIKAMEHLIDSKNKQIDVLIEEEHDFPSNEKIVEFEEKISENKLETNRILQEKSKKEDEIYHLNQKMKELEQSLNQMKNLYKIPLNLASYQEACAILRLIQEDLTEVKIDLSSISSQKELIKGILDHLQDNNKNYDDVIVRVNHLKEEMKVKNLELETIKKFTNSKEFQELSAKLDQIEMILATYHDKNGRMSQAFGVLTKELEQIELEKVCNEQEIKRNEVILEICHSILEEEIQLGYVQDVSIDSVSDILKRFPLNSDRNKVVATSNYYDGFNKYRQSLVDYNLVDVLIFNDKEAQIKLYEDKGVDRETIEEIFADATRQDITANYQNKKVNLYSLLTSLKDDYESNQVYLNEKDNYLFHDILLRSVGSKIKDKINRAIKWVEDINNIMKEKQESSNLSFHLSWLSKSPENLDEMDTRELVEIFKMDPDAVKPSVVDKLIKHFKSKIAKREEVMIDNKETYYDIIFSILDYRNWYEFKLFYKKDGKDRKELTNKTFSVFSGGEKAKTMYIPLFASMSAKLWGARGNAPRLIALDEAFAGVDDQNIEEMFGILKSFSLDYLLTSQALWCDYREVEDISICELIGDKESQTIGVKRYRWNGTSRISFDGE